MKSQTRSRGHGRQELSLFFVKTIPKNRHRTRTHLYVCINIQKKKETEKISEVIEIQRSNEPSSFC